LAYLWVSTVLAAIFKDVTQTTIYGFAVRRPTIGLWGIENDGAGFDGCDNRAGLVIPDAHKIDASSH